ncbi:hypothetical protein RQP50_08360 [Paenibacillus sp. chi10]|uniref:Uncharacterized protein n=1 Tax=Paenibacillus suaedae TaxID=3077233 RepID=A0AAJ2JT54_9BACL|nr:hypothetical protein [Paenibacillus sp. chi10]MDT8976256.1 hypothetical protein [Paenibacillus sp. chi10]
MKHIYAAAGFRVGMLRECIRTAHSYETLIIMGMLKRECRPQDGEFYRLKL